MQQHRHRQCFELFWETTRKSQMALQRPLAVGPPRWKTAHSRVRNGKDTDRRTCKDRMNEPGGSCRVAATCRQFKLRSALNCKEAPAAPFPSRKARRWWGRNPFWVERPGRPDHIGTFGAGPAGSLCGCVHRRTFDKISRSTSKITALLRARNHNLVDCRAIAFRGFIGRWATID